MMNPTQKKKEKTENKNQETYKNNQSNFLHA